MSGRSHDYQIQKKKRSSMRIVGQFAPRPIDMLESPAYRTLNLAEHRILARIEIELAHHGGLENGNLPITYEQFTAYGIRPNSIAPALRVVEALGFITIKHGRGGNAEYRQPNRFGLTYRHSQKARYGDVAVPTNEWQRIKTLEDALQIAEQKRSEKFRSRPTKWGAGPPYEMGGENPDLPPYEMGGTGTLTIWGVLLKSRGGGGDRDGEVSQSVPTASPSHPGNGSAPPEDVTLDSSSVIAFPGRRTS